MTGPKGNDEFCFLKTPSGKTEGVSETKLPASLGASNEMLIVTMYIEDYTTANKTYHSKK